MKLFIKSAFCAILTLCACFTLVAQEIVPIAEPDYNKPKLFAAFPQSIDVQLPIFESLLPLSEGSAVRFALGSTFFRVRWFLNRALPIRMYNQLSSDLPTLSVPRLHSQKLLRMMEAFSTGDGSSARRTVTHSN
jgi:hypothetical protein